MCPRLCTSCARRVVTTFVSSLAPAACPSRFLKIRPASTSTKSTPENVVRQARNLFGNTLPPGLLSPEEYALYERLFGPPSAKTTGEELRAVARPDRPNVFHLSDDVEVAEEDEIVYLEHSPDNFGEPIEETVPQGSDEDHGVDRDRGVDEGYPRTEEDHEVDEGYPRTEGDHEVDEVFPRTDEDHGVDEARIDLATEHIKRQSDTQNNDVIQSQEELYARVRELQATAVEDGQKKIDNVSPTDTSLDQVDEIETGIGTRFGKAEETDHDDEVVDTIEESKFRTHPNTLTGRFAGNPATMQLPKDSFVDPISRLLTGASSKHLVEVAQKALGGPGLPWSTCVAKGPNLKQRPIGLTASQYSMTEMEANVFMAAVMPGAYAACMSALVEARRRLGSQWLEQLVARGARVLDAGAGGAGVLAWREMLRSSLDSESLGRKAGQSTVVTGSGALRSRVSQLLDNTTYVPRLPEYDPSRDHPNVHGASPQPRKQYDVIFAPHTLWPIAEDYQRKFHVQNLWSLLDPRGGVLIVVEKGVPRGFELVAEARETLLRHHLPSALTSAENQFGGKEKGMIIAPCTSHGKCPLYLEAGESRRRRDYCFFSHRYIRPPFQQQVLRAKERNHEDIKFSFVAVQRGESVAPVQEQTTADRAFAGHSEKPPNPLTLPRVILPPIKRQGHVILDVCTPGGKLERWTVPRSYDRQAYRDARKAQWGDLWALGAKTRVPRDVRAGEALASATVVKDSRRR